MVDSACAQYPRFDDAWEALKWLLSRSANQVGRAPKSGNPNLRLYVQSGDVIANLPAIWVLYEIGQDDVTILDINIVPYDPDREE